MKTKLFIFLLIFTNCRINHTVQKYPLIATEKSSIWLEITDDFSYELVDQKNRYKLLKRKEYIFEGAHLLNSSLQTDNILLLIGFKTIGKSRD